MHPADEYLQIKLQMAALKKRADVLRENLIDDAGKRVSNAAVVTVRQQKRRVFLRELLPNSILTDPRYWEERTSAVVTVADAARAHLGKADADDDVSLIEDPVPF